MITYCRFIAATPGKEAVVVAELGKEYKLSVPNSYLYDISITVQDPKQLEDLESKLDKMKKEGFIMRIGEMEAS